MNEGTENNLEVMQMMKRISVMAMLAAILLLALLTVALAASPINKDDTTRASGWRGRLRSWSTMRTSR